MSEDKKYYKVLNPILLGERRERGEFIKLTKAEAENIGSDYVKEESPDDAEKKAYKAKEEKISTKKKSKK